jgi:hypothetical protein
MALIDESNLLAMKARAAKFRTNHVGTKLNQAELHEFEALVEKRNQSPSEFIRGLVLREIEEDKKPQMGALASVELEELTAIKLLLLNTLPRLLKGEKMSAETFTSLETEIKKRKPNWAVEVEKDWKQRSRKA